MTTPKNDQNKVSISIGRVRRRVSAARYACVTTAQRTKITRCDLYSAYCCEVPARGRRVCGWHRRRGPGKTNRCVQRMSLCLCLRVSVSVRVCVAGRIHMSVGVCLSVWLCVCMRVCVCLCRVISATVSGALVLHFRRRLTEKRLIQVIARRC